MTLNKNSFQNYEKERLQFQKYLKEVVEYGERFAEKYNFDADFFLTTECKEKVNIVLKDLEIIEKSYDTYAFLYYKSYLDSSCKYIYCHPEGIDRYEYYIGAIYVVALKLFRENKEKSFCYQFEFPVSFSTILSDIEKAFIYSVIMPYSHYKKSLEKFFALHCKNIEEVKHSELSKLWIEYVAYEFHYDYKLSTLISEFYMSIFFDDINRIWNDNILAIDDKKYDMQKEKLVKIELLSKMKEVERLNDEKRKREEEEERRKQEEFWRQRKSEIMLETEKRRKVEEETKKWKPVDAYVNSSTSYSWESAVRYAELRRIHNMLYYY